MYKKMTLVKMLAERVYAINVNALYLFWNHESLCQNSWQSMQENNGHLAKTQGKVCRGLVLGT